MLVADFSDLKAVKQLAEQIKFEIPKINVLINNAGIFKTKTTITKDSLEIRIVVNYLAP
ncbi:SDR family NAD(P)-dependent oxidoreductase [Winogradskyella sp. PC D3.3]